MPVQISSRCSIIRNTAIQNIRGERQGCESSFSVLQPEGVPSTAELQVRSPCPWCFPSHFMVCRSSWYTETCKLRNGATPPSVQSQLTQLCAQFFSKSWSSDAQNVCAFSLPDFVFMLSRTLFLSRHSKKASRAA
jgi:hypothetical protein